MFAIGFPLSSSALVPLLLLAVALVVGLRWFSQVWEETHEEDDPVSDAELLEEFEKAHAEGALDDQEFTRVRALLASGGFKGTKPPVVRTEQAEPAPETPNWVSGEPVSPDLDRPD